MVLPVHAWLSHPLRLELSRIRPRDLIISHTEYAVMACYSCGSYTSCSNGSSIAVQRKSVDCGGF